MHFAFGTFYNIKKNFFNRIANQLSYNICSISVKLRYQNNETKEAPYVLLSFRFC